MSVRSPKGQYITYNGRLGMDPFAALDALGQREPFWVDDPTDIDGFWVATRFEDVRDILQDAETFSSIDGQIPFVKMAEPLLPTETDPPYTQKLRSILMPRMTPKHTLALDHRIKSICAEIIEGFRERGHCDAVAEFAHVFPITVFIEFFGLPADQKEEFRKQADTFLHYADQRAEAWAVIRRIVEDQILAKRETPTDDLLSAIAQGTIDGKLLDLNVAVSVASTVFLGGLDTLPSNIGWSLRFLARNPDDRQKIVKRPEIIPRAVEEFLRLFSVANPVRRATRDVLVGGSEIKAGDRIQLSISSANRDVTIFGNKPDLERATNPHLTFATGPHRCLGSHLARHELAIGLETWHRLIPDYRVADDAQFTYQGPIFAMNSLPLQWDV